MTGLPRGYGRFYTIVTDPCLNKKQSIILKMEYQKLEEGYTGNIMLTKKLKCQITNTNVFSFIESTQKCKQIQTG